MNKKRYTLQFNFVNGQRWCEDVTTKSEAEYYGRNLSDETVHKCYIIDNVTGNTQLFITR